MIETIDYDLVVQTSQMITQLYSFIDTIVDHIESTKSHVDHNECGWKSNNLLSLSLDLKTTRTELEVVFEKFMLSSMDQHLFGVSTFINVINKLTNILKMKKDSDQEISDEHELFRQIRIKEEFVKKEDEQTEFKTDSVNDSLSNNTSGPLAVAVCKKGTTVKEHPGNKGKEKLFEERFQDKTELNARSLELKRKIEARIPRITLKDLIWESNLLPEDNKILKEDLALCDESEDRNECSEVQYVLGEGDSSDCGGNLDAVTLPSDECALKNVSADKKTRRMKRGKDVKVRRSKWSEFGSQYESKIVVTNSGAKVVKLVCPFCSKLYTRPRLVVHLKKHSNTRPWICDECGGAHFSKRYLDLHIQRVHIDQKAKKKYACSKCLYSCDSQVDLNMHMILHSQSKPFRCKCCDFETWNWDKIKNHTKLHKDEETPLQCMHCPVSRSREKFLLHIMTHQGKRHVVCPTCGASFRTKINFRSHFKTHGEKTFHCNICGHSTSTAANLKRHMRKHSGEKPYGCKICQKKFSHKCGLNNHQRVHTGEKPFHCTKCGASFTQKASVSKHDRNVHMDIRPYQCIQCGLRFKRNGHLKDHLLTHTNEPRKTKTKKHSGEVTLVV